MNNIISNINQIAENWYSIIAPHSVQLIIIFVIIFIIDKLFKNQSAIFGYGLWMIFILKALIPIKISLFTNNETISNIVYLNEVIAKPIRFAAPVNVQFSLESILFMIWVVGILFLIARFIFTEKHFQHILNNSEKITGNKILLTLKNKIGIKKNVELFSSENIPAPFTIGIFKAKIYIPKEVYKTNDEQLKSILAHELAHIKRVDIFPIILQTFVNIFYFFNPFIWLANRNINFYREKVCDEIAFTNLGIEPKKYGRTLLSNLELLFVKKSRPILANNLFLSKKIIIKRMESLFKQKGVIMLKLKKTQWIFLVMIGILAVMMSCEKRDINDATSRKIEYDKPAVPLEKDGRIIVDNSSAGEYKIMKITYYFEVLIDEKGKIVKFPKSNFNSQNGKIFNELMKMSKDEIIKKAKNTKFKPSTKNGEPIESWVLIPFTIKFDEEKLESAMQSFRKNEKQVAYDSPAEPIGGREKIINNLIYPKKAKKANAEGTVIVQAYINKKGSVVDCKVMYGMPNTGMNESAINAIKKTKFKPAIKDGKPIGTWMSIPVHFGLNDNKDNRAKFVPYDTPPMPIGGPKAIVNNIVYPEKAKESKIEGRVIIQAFINEKGIVSDWTIINEQSHTNKELRKAAVNAIKKTKFIPAKQKGKPVGVWIAVPINFKLKKKL